MLNKSSKRHEKFRMAGTFVTVFFYVLYRLLIQLEKNSNDINPSEIYRTKPNKKMKPLQLLVAIVVHPIMVSRPSARPRPPPVPLPGMGT
jgi:hypothetical protein